MRSVAAAFAWEFQKRLGWGLVAIGVYLTVLGGVQLGILGSPYPIRPTQELAFAFTVLVPLSFAFLYLLAVFSYGLSGDLAARQSLYPARMFSLPVSTAGLAGWPMLYGGVTVAGVWVAATFLAFRPSGIPAPLVWPAVFAAAFLAWMQVFTWMPYGLPGVRVIAAVFSLTAIAVVALTALEFQLRESSMIALMAPQLPLAYLAACFAVGRARRGDTPEWRGVLSRLGRVTGVLPKRRAVFPSAAHAQRWFEWRQHGHSLPAWTAILVPFEILLLVVVRNEPAVLTLVALVFMLLTPPFLAAFVAVTVGRSSADASSAYGLAPFVATRPLGTARLAAAKLRMALFSTLLAWLMVLVGIPLGLTVSGSWPVVVERARVLTDFFGPPRASVFAFLCFLLLLSVTWKQLVQGLAIGLTGREGLIKSSVLIRLSSLVFLGLIVQILDVSVEARVFLWNAVPWILALLVSFKMCAAVWITKRLHRERLLANRVLVACAAGWLVVVLALCAVCAWFVSTPLVAHALLMLLAILAVPVARPSAALLALAWSRHRGAVVPSESAADGSKSVLAVAQALLAVPAALALVMAMSFHVRNRNNGAFVSSGEPREYLLYVPRSYDAARPTPLVISLHGGGLWPVPQRDISLWNRVADEHGFIVVYPSGVSGRGPRAWRVAARRGSLRDIRFLAELIDSLKSSYTIDPTRIYADGLSNGGGMAFLLSCALADRIAAVGLVASAQFLSWDACQDVERPVPMIAFHGTEDRFTPYHGGVSWAGRNHVFPSIPAFTETWARRNRCTAGPVESVAAPDVRRLEYRDCADGAPVVLYTILGGGHTWPGGGPAPRWFVGTTSKGIDATRTMWEFFAEHPLRRTPPWPVER
jgi:polyhydroxybutyrate depolymerase